MNQLYMNKGRVIQAKLFPSRLVSLMFFNLRRTSWYLRISASLSLLVSFKMSSFYFQRSFTRQFSSFEYCSSSYFVFARISASLWPMLLILFMISFFQNQVRSSSPLNFYRCFLSSFSSAFKNRTSSLSFSLLLKSYICFIESSILMASVFASCLYPMHLALKLLIAPYKMSIFFIHSCEMLKDVLPSCSKQSDEKLTLFCNSSSSSMFLSSSLLSVQLLSWARSSSTALILRAMRVMMSSSCLVLLTSALSIQKQLLSSPGCRSPSLLPLVSVVFLRVAFSLSIFMQSCRIVLSRSSIISLSPKVAHLRTLLVDLLPQDRRLRDLQLLRSVQLISQHHNHQKYKKFIGRNQSSRQVYLLNGQFSLISINRRNRVNFEPFLLRFRKLYSSSANQQNFWFDKICIFYYKFHLMFEKDIDNLIPSFSTIIIILLLNQSHKLQAMSQAFESQEREVTHSPKELEGELARRFQFIGSLGEGTFGTVSAVYDRTKQSKFALKKIKLSRKIQGLPPTAIREVALLKSLSHPHIVKIEDVFYDCEVPSLSFTLELLPHNLHDLLKQKYQLPLKKVKQFARQLLQALQFLHRKGIIHRDLKPQNLLVTSDQVLKLCDFGQAKLTLFGQYKHTPDISTLWYRAPQILLGAAEYDEGVDVWAAGCVIAEMALGKPLFRGNSELAMIHSIFQLMGTPKQADYPDISKMQYYSPTFPKFDPIAFSIDGITKEGEDLLRKLLVVNPKNRLTVEDALRHEFLCDQE